jgi:hypothetical protein
MNVRLPTAHFTESGNRRRPGPAGPGIRPIRARPSLRSCRRGFARAPHRQLRIEHKAGPAAAGMPRNETGLGSLRDPMGGRLRLRPSSDAVRWRARRCRLSGSRPGRDRTRKPRRGGPAKGKALGVSGVVAARPWSPLSARRRRRNPARSEHPAEAAWRPARFRGNSGPPAAGRNARATGSTTLPCSTAARPLSAGGREQRASRAI